MLSDLRGLAAGSASSWVSLLAFVGAASIAQAAPGPQQPQQKPPTPVFRGGVEVVVIDVTVVDRSGVPIRGLSVDDFVVMVGGQRRRIEAVDFLEFGPSDEQIGHPGSAVLGNVPLGGSTGSRGGRIVVVGVDDLSARPVEIAGLLAAAERILGTVGPTDLVGLVTTSGFGPFVPPTSDREMLRRALRNKELAGRKDSTAAPYFITTKEALEVEERARRGPANEIIHRECGQPPDDWNCPRRVANALFRLGVEARHRRDEQLRAYASIVEGMRMLPRPRILVVLGKGLATDGGEQREEIRQIGHMAAAADVRFYALADVDESLDMSHRGPPPLCNDGACDPHRARRDEATFLLGGLQIVADAAGGEAFRVIGQADRLLERVLSETSGVYRLGIEVPADRRAEPYEALRVTTTRPGLTVRASRYLARAGSETADVPIDEALRRRIAQGGHAFGVPMTLATAVRGDPRTGEQEVGISARVPGETPGPLEVAFAILDGEGRVQTAGQRTVEAAAFDDAYEVSLRVPVKVVPGGYRLRVAVADAEGRIASVERRVRPDVADLGPVLASEIFLNWSGEDGRLRFVAFDAVPPAATALSCAIELYPSGPTMEAGGLRVRFAFQRDSQDVVVLDGDVAARSPGSALSATATVPTSRLPAGEYTLTVTVLDRGQPLGTRSTTFRIG